MPTLDDGAETLERAVEVLQTILDEECVEFFTEEWTPTTDRAGRRIIEIGPLLYSSPRDALHVSLWETLAAMHPQMKKDEG